MTIDNVTAFGPPNTPPPTDTLEDHFGADAWKLKMLALWRAERAQQQKNWAENEVASGWGYLTAGVKLDTKPLERMGALQHHLADFKPCTVLLACELLDVCKTILAHQKEEPEEILADGPVLEIIRNVVESLRFLAGNTRIGPETAKPNSISDTSGGA